GCGLSRLEVGSLLFETDFLFEGALQLVRRPLEFSQALAKGSAELGQLPRTEKDQSDHENDEQLRHSNRTKHNAPKLLKPGRGDSQSIIGTRRERGQEIPCRKIPRSYCG